MSLTATPLFAKVKPYLTVQTYDRDGGHANPRHRIEVMDVAPDVRVFLLGLTVPCAACQRPIHPIRSRRGVTRSMYVAVTCDLAAGYACARGRAAHDEYERIVAAVGAGVPDDRQPSLFTE